ncbi:hypothetical protein U1Q18_002276, partial [Sarracenia purpurea var. burkii]
GRGWQKRVECCGLVARSGSSDVGWVEVLLILGLGVGEDDVNYKSGLGLGMVKGNGRGWRKRRNDHWQSNQGSSGVRWAACSGGVVPAMGNAEQCACDGRRYVQRSMVARDGRRCV